MDLFVNELSLHRQFSSLAQFVGALKEVIGCRDLADYYRHPFYCFHTIANQEVLPGTTLKEAVRQTRDINLIRRVMSWFDKHGPFWENERMHGPGDYFAYGDDVITDSSLGEATFRMGIGHTIGIISFPESRFCLTLLSIIWHQSDQRATRFDLPNFWQRSTLETYLDTHDPPPQSWLEVIERAQQRFTALTFIPTIADALKGEPFNVTIAERVLVLLAILHRLKGCFDETSVLTPEGHTILEQFFHGERALFSDESDTNKRLFAAQMTFRLPTGEAIFCPFHGKISTRFYRIHHSWPIRPDQPLYIAYIGPKITKN